MAVRDAAVAAGYAVARITQPYRVAGRRGVAPAPQLDAAWLGAVAAVRRRRGLAGLPLIVGGRSSGARVAARTAAQAGAQGVVALAFPVHPPGKPQSSRLPELDQVSVPVLVIQGDRDPFGMPPAAVGRRVVVIEGADHGLKKGRATIAAAVVGFVSSLSDSDRHALSDTGSRHSVGGDRRERRAGEPDQVVRRELDLQAAPAGGDEHGLELRGRGVDDDCQL